MNGQRFCKSTCACETVYFNEQQAADLRNPRLRNGATRCPNNYKHFVLLVFAMPFWAWRFTVGVDLYFTASDIAAIGYCYAGDFVSGLKCSFSYPRVSALARQNFKGREVLISILSAPFILPVIVQLAACAFLAARVLNQFLAHLAKNRVYLWTFWYPAGACIL